PVFVRNQTHRDHSPRVASVPARCSVTMLPTGPRSTTAGSSRSRRAADSSSPGSGTGRMILGRYTGSSRHCRWHSQSALHFAVALHIGAPSIRGPYADVRNGVVYRYEPRVLGLTP